MSLNQDIPAFDPKRTQYPDLYGSACCVEQQQSPPRVIAVDDDFVCLVIYLVRTRIEAIGLYTEII